MLARPPPGTRLAWVLAEGLAEPLVKLRHGHGFHVWQVFTAVIHVVWSPVPSFGALLNIAVVGQEAALPAIAAPAVAWMGWEEWHRQ